MIENSIIYYNKKDLYDSNSDILLLSDSKLVISDSLRDLNNKNYVYIELLVTSENRPKSTYFPIDVMCDDNVIKDNKGRIIGYAARNKKIRIFKKSTHGKPQSTNHTIDIFVENVNDYFHKHFIEEKIYKRINSINDILNT